MRRLAPVLIVIALLALVGGGVALAWYLRAEDGRGPILTRPDLIERARELGREAWRDQHPGLPLPRCLELEPLVRPEGDERAFIRFAFTRQVGDTSLRQSVELTLDVHGAPVGPVICSHDETRVPRQPPDRGDDGGFL